jgi:phosphoribosylglycinamide formyltransferase-1
MIARKKVAVLISGGGSNLQALIDACAAPDFPAQITLVISNQAEAFGLQRAEKAGIPTQVISHRDYASRADFEAALHHALVAAPIDIICLAGFMRVLEAEFVQKWAGKMLNIHPSLLPAYKGLHTHRRALEAGETEAGCTVHFVSPDLDSGDVILQARVPILAGDTEASLAARVLEQEHRIYPAALKQVAGL